MTLGTFPEPRFFTSLIPWALPGLQRGKYRSDPEEEHDNFGRVSFPSFWVSGPTDDVRHVSQFEEPPKEVYLDYLPIAADAVELFLLKRPG